MEFPRSFRGVSKHWPVQSIDAEHSLDSAIEVSHRSYRTCLLEARLQSRHNCK